MTAVTTRNVTSGRPGSSTARSQACALGSAEKSIRKCLTPRRFRSPSPRSTSIVHPTDPKSIARAPRNETTELDDRQPRPRDGDRQPLDEKGEPASAPSRAAQIAGRNDPRASAVTELNTALGLALYAPSSTRPRNSPAVRASSLVLTPSTAVRSRLRSARERATAGGAPGRELGHDRDPMDPSTALPTAAQCGQDAGVTGVGVNGQCPGRPSQSARSEVAGVPIGRLRR